MKVTFELVKNILILSVNLMASITNFIAGNTSAGFAWVACCFWFVALVICEHRCRMDEEVYIKLLHDKAFIINLALVMEEKQKESKPDDNHD